MSKQNPLTPAERIALVDKDRIRRYGQIILTFILIGFSLGFVAWFAFYKADGAFLSYMATGMLGVVFAGVGAAYAIMGLGRTVGSSNDSNNETIVAILAELQKLRTAPNVKLDLTSLPNIEDPDEDDEPATLHEELPAEVPPSAVRTIAS